MNKIPDKDRWLALLSYDLSVLMKEDANGIADWIRSQTNEITRLEIAVEQSINNATRLTAEIARQRTVNNDLMESLDEAKYDEPKLRSKLDKQRRRIELLTAEVSELKEDVYRRDCDIEGLNDEVNALVSGSPPPESKSQERRFAAQSGDDSSPNPFCSDEAVTCTKCLNCLRNTTVARQQEQEKN